MDNIIYFQIPKTCPICGERTSIHNENGSEVLYCINPSCEGKLINKIEHLLGKRGLDAKGISKATIEKLINWGWVTKISDMFKLSSYEKEWKNISGFGEKSVDNILQSIKESCNTNFESIISGAGIPLIGRTVARDLSKKFDGYSDFRKAVKNGFNFTQYQGFGYEMDKSIKSFDYSEIDYIVENYLQEQKINKDTDNKLENKVFVITGKVKEYKNRDELKNIIESMGGKVTGSVSKNTNYLINNDTESTSAKNLKAKELDIPIISELEFKKIFDIK